MKMRSPSLSAVWGILLLLVSSTSAAFVQLPHGPRGARGVVSTEDGAGLSRLTTSSATTTCLSATKKKKAVKKAATKAPVETYKKAEFVAELSGRTGLTKKDAEVTLQTVLDIVQEQVGEGKKLAFPGFGTFTLKDRAERKGRNPQTGEELLIPASKSPSFSVSKTWKDTINGK